MQSSSAPAGHGFEFGASGIERADVRLGLGAGTDDLAHSVSASRPGPSEFRRTGVVAASGGNRRGVARSRLAIAPPTGLVYQQSFLTPGEEHALLTRIETLEFQQIVMKGVVARRAAVRFGMGYDYNRRTPSADADPMPEWLLLIRDRGTKLAGVRGPSSSRC